MPAYRKVEEDLRARIREGYWPKGAMLPGRKALAEEYGVNLETIQRGIKELVDDGILVADSRRGTFVAVDTESAGAPAREPAPGTAESLQESADPRPVAIGMVTYLEIRSGWIASMVNMKALEAVEEACAAPSFICKSVNLCGNGAAPDTSVGDAARNLAAEGVSGLIIVVGFHHEQVDYADLMDIPVPIVMILLVQERTLFPTVCYDHRDAGHLAAKHLLEQGCRHIVFFSANTQQWALDRRTGAREAMIMARRAPEDLREWIVDASAVGHHDRGDGLNIAAEWLDRRIPFDGVVAANDTTALEFMEVAAARGLVAGRDYAIIGFDDIPQARFSQLTSVKAPIEAMGREAVSLISGMLQGKPMSKRVTLHSTLVVRQSTVINER